MNRTAGCQLWRSAVFLLMYTTAEIRWFWKGPLPDFVKAWKIRAGFPEVEEESRTDHYVKDLKSGNGNIKIREGQLQAKLLVRNISLTAELALIANAELWEKWTAEGVTFDHQGALSREDGYLALQKTRQVAVFNPQAESWQKKQTETEALCEVETGSVVINDRVFSSLCLECHDKKGNYEGVLEISAKRLLDREIKRHLEKKHSYSYAALIRKISNT